MNTKPQTLRALVAVSLLALVGHGFTGCTAPISVNQFVTLAGTAGIPGVTDGTGSAARFDRPPGVAVDGAGTVYVADGHLIRKITSGGVVTTLAGGSGNFGRPDGTGSAAGFRYPCGVAVDDAGNVFVGDTDGFNGAIRQVTPAGVVTTLAAQFDTPYGVAGDGSGTFFVADTIRHTIHKMGSTGVATVHAGTRNSAGSSDGRGSAARFHSPNGVAVDAAGNVYVADTGNHTIRKITSGGVVMTLAGEAGKFGSADGRGNAARFNRPVGVAVDKAGNVYVADNFNHTIRKITARGVVTTFAGMAGSPGSADGPRDLARFNYPNGVAVGSDGRIYVVDTYNNTIRVYPGPRFRLDGPRRP